VRARNVVRTREQVCVGLDAVGSLRQHAKPYLHPRETAEKELAEGAQNHAQPRRLTRC